MIPSKSFFTNATNEFFNYFMNNFDVFFNHDWNENFFEQICNFIVNCFQMNFIKMLKSCLKKLPQIRHRWWQFRISTSFIFNLLLFLVMLSGCFSLSFYVCFRLKSWQKVLSNFKFVLLFGCRFGFLKAETQRYSCGEHFASNTKCCFGWSRNLTDSTSQMASLKWICKSLACIDFLITSN